MRNWQTRITPSREVSPYFTAGSSGPLDQDFNENATIYENQGQDIDSPKEKVDTFTGSEFTNMATVSTPIRTNFPSWIADRGATPSNRMNEANLAHHPTPPSNSSHRPRSADDEHRMKLESLRLSAQEQFGDWLTSPRHAQGGKFIDESSVSPTDVRASPPKVLTMNENIQHSSWTPLPHNLTKSSSVNFDQTSTYTTLSSTARSSVGTYDVQQSLPTPFSAYHDQDGFRALYEFQPNVQGSGTVDTAQSSYFNPVSPTSSFVEAEFSVFVGDLCPDLREEDLVNQFINPPLWPPSHPFAIAHAHAQQAKGKFGTPPKVGPAPFLSTKSAAIMTDPLTGLSRGFGFVRFTSEMDCARALVEMQGIIIQPVSGQGGRPLRVCPATPKNRSASNPTQNSLASSATVQEKLMSAIRSPGEGGSTFEQHVDQMNSARETFMPTTPYSPTHHFSSPPPASAVPSRHQTVIGGAEYPQTSAAVSINPLLSSTSGTGASDSSNTTVFVGGLSSLISEETLKTFFMPFGEIKYVKIPPGKGCGFVQFLNKADAERAIDRMQGFPIGGGRIRLSWGRSQSDKAAAAAAQAAAQAAQIGRLAGLAGLSSNETSQFTAVTLAAGGNNSNSETQTELIKQLTAAAFSGAQLSQKMTPPQRMPTDPEVLAGMTSSSFPPFMPVKSSSASSLTFDPFASNSSPWQEQSGNELQNRSVLPMEAAAPGVSPNDLLKAFTSLQLGSGDQINTQGWSNRTAREVGEIGQPSTSRNTSSNIGGIEIGTVRQRGHTLAMTPTSWSNTNASNVSQSSTTFSNVSPNVEESSTMAYAAKRPNNASYRDSFDSKFNPFGSEDAPADNEPDQDESSISLQSPEK
ncbi:hypothetical protein L7F22_019549 [Adiantum nelumboides]|nr:hypothetical protein [Adiantum nelumboides]